MINPLDLRVPSRIPALARPLYFQTKEMERIRFHGRGGQGAKTASRIVGMAAFLEGDVAQDSPVYGAERRGAPVAAA